MAELDHAPSSMSDPLRLFGIVLLWLLGSTLIGYLIATVLRNESYTVASFIYGWLLGLAGLLLNLLWPTKIVTQVASVFISWFVGSTLVGILTLVLAIALGVGSMIILYVLFFVA